ncbi:unnamed protein product [Rotaria sordida]|uniref:Cyclic nucleotide-binding domain-containing protein n=3 Tax=Rotaria sordida TaxID=392033 RepID=A0A813MKI7_9BILA|nr:unnamed protein product [Rotaria sordida]CAF0831962.1 unnamed protein product [Rotaria sordida]
MEVINITSLNKTANNERKSTGSIILVLSFAILISCLCKIIFIKFLRHKVNLSFNIIVLFLGFLIGIIATQIKGGVNEDDFLRGELQLSKISPHLIYYIFLPLIIFDSSFNTNVNIVKQQFITTCLVAVPGVLISTGIITLFVVYLFPSDYQWSWRTGLLFGSILSTTDPVTIVTLLQDCGASHSLSSLIESESLLNDGLVFMLFSILDRMIVDSSYTIRQIIVDIFRQSIGGPLFGIICGFLCVFVLNRINNELKIEITITFGMTYFIFYIADAALGISAVLSLISMGLYMAKHKYCISTNVQLSMAGAWEIITFVVNILIFTISGLILAHSFVGIQTNLTSRDIGIALVLYLLIHVSRALIVGVLYPVITWSGMPLNRKECVIFAWSGLRGRTATILVLLIYLDSEIDSATRERFLFHISLIVLFTLIINGASSKFLVKMLGLHKGTPESQSVLLQALKHMRSQTSRQINNMKEDINFANVDWKILNNYLPEKLLEELDEERDTNIHQKLCVTPTQTHDDLSLESISIYSDPLQNQHYSDQISIDSIYQFDLDSLPNDQYILQPFIEQINNSDLDFECHEMNMRNEIIKRFLTAMSVDYEKQWYLGMIRRRTLRILIETIEEAKAKLSLKRHWQLLVEHFCMPLWLQCFVKFHKIKYLNIITEKLLFNHLILTIELALAFHSAKSRLENMLTKFPEFANIDNYIINNVLNEAKMLRVRASLVLHDLQHSYKKCWTIEMTKRCAQMLLKYESVAIVQLYETGMLNENEYTHILKLIQKKLFHLEHCYFMGVPKIHLNQEQDSPFDNLSLFVNLTEDEKVYFKELLETRHRWFQPGEILLRQGYMTTEAYLIIRGIVECSEDLLTCYRSGHIIGIDALFDKSSSVSNRTYRAESSIVEAYTIDESILNMFLSNVKMTRLIYNEIALHMLINMYQQPIHLLNYAQIKVLLDEYAIFYQNEIDHDLMTIQLKRNERLFLLVGTVQREEDDYFMDGPQLVTVNQLTSFYCSLDKLCIAYTWTLENEQECLQIVRSFTTSFRLSDSSQVKANTTMIYPSYSGYTTEFTPQYHSLIQVARSAALMSNIELIPMEITDLYHEKT